MELCQVLGIPDRVLEGGSPGGSAGYGVPIGTLPRQIPQDPPDDRQAIDIGARAPGGQHSRPPALVESYNDDRGLVALPLSSRCLWRSCFISSLCSD